MNSYSTDLVAVDLTDLPHPAMPMYSAAEAAEIRIWLLKYPWFTLRDWKGKGSPFDKDFVGRDEVPWQDLQPADVRKMVARDPARCLPKNVRQAAARDPGLIFDERTRWYRPRTEFDPPFVPVVDAVGWPGSVDDAAPAPGGPRTPHPCPAPASPSSGGIAKMDAGRPTDPLPRRKVFAPR